jgi:hypothetical protein
MGATSERTELASVDREHLIDLTVDARTTRWLAASSKVGYLEPAGRRWRRKGQDPIPVPQGQQHAYRPGDRITACGTRLTALHPWDDRPFNDGLLNRCAECIQHTRQAADASAGRR